MLLMGAVALALAACATQSDPIAVYITPTADGTVLAGLDGAPVYGAAGAAATDIPTLTPTVTPTPPPSATPVPSPTPQAVAQVQPTATFPPDTSFGPITGPDYTPEPRYTPLPDLVSDRACQLTVSASQVNLYASPDASAEVRGTAAQQDALVVLDLFTGSDGAQWANTPVGWIMLNNQGAELARLDNLRSCELMAAEEVKTTLVGLHVLNWTANEEVMKLVERMAQAGVPLGTVKGLNGTEPLLQQIEEVSPYTVTIYRSLYTNTGEYDCPPNAGGDSDPVAVAQEWYASLQEAWSAVNVDYYELTNECQVPLDWMAQFSIESMRLANEEGRCLILFSFSGGQPSIESYQLLKPAYEYALANECQPGRHHALAFHAYSLDDTIPLSETDVWVGFRHRIMTQEMQKVLPQADQLPVYITEAAVGRGMYSVRSVMSCPDIAEDYVRYAYQLENDPYVKGFHAFSIGGESAWLDLSPCLEDFGNVLLQYYNLQ
jgi:hypothetical protein